jgi:hypothetical protein
LIPQLSLQWETLLLFVGLQFPPKHHHSSTPLQDEPKQPILSWLVQPKHVSYRIELLHFLFSFVCFLQLPFHPSISIPESRSIVKSLRELLWDSQRPPLSKPKSKSHLY